MFGGMKHKLYILMLGLPLAGCISQSDIQSSYVSQQDDCRAQLQSVMARAGATGPEAQTAIATQFSNCMNKAGWHVPLPKGTGPQPPIQVVENPPTGSPSTNPHAALSTAPPTGGVAPSEGTAAITRQATHQPVANPPAGAPSTAPSAAAARVAQPSPSGGTPNLPGGAASTNPAAAVPSAPIAKPATVSTSPTGQTTIAPSTYQPARPMGTPSTNYGTGAGRQF